VDGRVLGGFDGTTLVNGLTSDVHDTTKGTVANGNLNGGTSVGGLGTSNETLGTVHGNASDNVLTQMLSDFEDQLLVAVLGCNSVENSRELVGIEFDVYDSTNDRMDLAIL